MKQLSWKYQNLKSVCLQEWDINDHLDLDLSKRKFHILSVKKGTFDIALEGIKHSIGKNQFVFLHRNAKWEINSSDQAIVESITISHKFLINFSQINHGDNFRLFSTGVLPKSELSGLSYELFKAAFKAKQDSLLVVDLLTEFLFHFFYPIEKVELRKEVIKKVKAAIRIREKETIQIGILSDNFLVTTFQLIAGFIQHKNLTPHMYQISRLCKSDSTDAWTEIVRNKENFDELINSLRTV